MEAVLYVVAGLYCMSVGLHGNAMALFSQVSKEKQFLYWIVAILLITALWGSPVGGKVAKPLAALCVLGFLLTTSSSGQRNYQLVGTGLKTLMPGSN